MENSGANIRTSRNDDKKIPAETTKAHGISKSKYQIKVAVVNTGSGVNYPTEMASVILTWVNTCNLSTNSDWINASNT